MTRLRTGVASRSERRSLHCVTACVVTPVEMTPWGKGKAFTLIELLVVIAIVAVLMAILVPVLRRVRKQARFVVCQSNLKQWGALWGTAVAESNGRLPGATEDDWRYSRGWGPYWGWGRYGGDASSFWTDQIDGIRCCPMASKPVDYKEELTYARWSAGGTFRAWREIRSGAAVGIVGEASDSEDQEFYGSYAANKWLYLPNWSLKQRRERQEYGYYWKTPDVKGANNVPVMLDSCWPWGGWLHSDSGVHPPQCDAVPDCYLVGRMGHQGFCINRHEGYVNGVFVDGSVRKVGLKELWTLKWNRQYDTANRWTKAGGARAEDWPEWMRGFKDY